MTTYRLPDWLGGHEIKTKAHRFTGYGEVIDAVIDIPDGLEVTVSFPAVCLVEVKPPLLPWKVVADTDFQLSINVWTPGEVTVLAMDLRTHTGQMVNLTPAQARDAAAALLLAAEREQS